MNIFQQIGEWFKKLWEWLKSLFGSKKKNPILKITILTTFLFFFNFDNSYAQRTDLQYLWAFFTQPEIENVDYWTVHWYNGGADSLDAYKNDSIRVSIRNQAGDWVANTYIIGIDTADVRIKIDKTFHYDITFTFYIIARNQYGEAIGDSVTVRYLLSDINKIIDPDMESGYRIGDHSIDGLDLIEMSRGWGKSGLGYRDFVDITGDGYVDGLDLIQLSKDWGKTWIP